VINLGNGHAKFQLCSARGTFLNWGLNGGGVENSLANWPYLGNGERLLLLTNRKWHLPFQIT